MSVIAKPALELARQVRDREVSPVELLEAHIARIEQVNPAINAVVEKRYEAAREEARAAERAVGAKGAKLGPLHGVPCTVKEFLAVEGLKQTGGLYIRRDHVARRNATVVDRLRGAGAIVMGTTNAPEGGLWHETHNRVYGRTANPHDLYRTSGGSSGGEGAIVAAGGSPFGIGSDVGGSIRIPSAFCGIFGHKPTHGLIPNTGHFPEAPPEPYMAVGPMTRSARDLMPLLRVLAGPDGEDPHARQWGLGDPDAVDLSGLTVYPVPTNGQASVAKHMRGAVMDAATALQNRGARVRELEVGKLKHAFTIWATLMSDLGIAYDQLVTDGGVVPLRTEFRRWAQGRSRHTGAVLAMIALERALHRLPDQTERMRRMASELQSELEVALGDRGVLLHPPFSRVAPHHRQIGIGNPADAGVTAVFNILQFPVTVAPVGQHDGVPTAVQIIGRRGNDHLTIAAAMALEDAFGGWSVVEPRRGRRPRLALA
ncbi:MAG: amidase [Alphaproteobacteria bacterium]|nr:amidase [Alphaproteobacteria bacterium]